MSQEPPRIEDPLERALKKLMSLHEGYAGVAEVVACGQAAAPALTAILLHTETSGIFEPRCRAVAALSALGAYETLIDFLNSTKSIADPTARAGEEAVINAAARALSGVRDNRVVPALTRIAERRSLAGVIEALGAQGDPRHIPLLIQALHEDESRKAASAALVRISAAARSALLRALIANGLKRTYETSSTARARQAMASLLGDIGVDGRDRPVIRSLIWDRDPVVAAHACRACLREGPARHEGTVAARLSFLISRLKTPDREMAIDCLRQQQR